MERNGEKEVGEPLRAVSWTTIALIAGLLLLVLIIVYFASRGNSNQDKLTNPQVATKTAANPEKLCASAATYDLMKHELFRRAAQLRGTDQAAYDRLSAAAVVRMENPIMESQDSSTGAVNCSGSLSLDLPPGVAAVGGKTTLSSDVDYTIQPAADGSGNVILLRNADAIIAPLATLARTEQPQAQPEQNTDTEATEENQNEADQEQPPPAAPQPAPQQTSRPSFDCANARTRGESSVCADSNLATLDRNMAVEYGRAFNVATPEQRDLLKQTARRFYAYRDHCPDRQCIAAAYAGRIREIRDIVQGRWQPPQ
jgi:hypothetical protein